MPVVQASAQGLAPVVAVQVPARRGPGGAGQGGQGQLEPACDAYAPRPAVPELLIGPTGLQNTLIGLMDAAVESIDVMMYQFGCNPCVAGLVAAQNRGVKVRVSLDGDQYINDSARTSLENAGVEVRSAPSEFNHAHAKVMIVDGQLAVVMSANMNIYSMASERNYGVIDRDPQDVAQVQAIFERDFNGSGEVDVSCTRLIVSPEKRSRAH